MQGPTKAKGQIVVAKKKSLKKMPWRAVIKTDWICWQNGESCGRKYRDFPQNPATYSEKQAEKRKIRLHFLSAYAIIGS